MTTGIGSSHTTQVHRRKQMDIILINTIKYEIVLQTENLKVWRILEVMIVGCLCTAQLQYSSDTLLLYLSPRVKLPVCSSTVPC